MKNIDTIKKEAFDINESLRKTLEVYHLGLEDVGVFYINGHIINDNDVAYKKYPVNIFYNINKNEIHQLKVDFTHRKIKEAVIIEKQKDCSFAS